MFGKSRVFRIKELPHLIELTLLIPSHLSPEQHGVKLSQIIISMETEADINSHENPVVKQPSPNIAGEGESKNSFALAPSHDKLLRQEIF